MKKVFLISLLFSIITCSALAQDTYIRPSVSIINVDFRNNKSVLDMNSVSFLHAGEKIIKIPANLDEVKLSNKSFYVNTNPPKILMSKEKETATASELLWGGGESDEVIWDRNDEVEKSFISSRISNDAVLAITPIKNGKYDYQHIQARGVNSATDQDVNLTSQTMTTELGSEEERFLYIADKMWDANYVIAYHMGDFRRFSDGEDIGFENAISYWVIKVANVNSSESGLMIAANQLPTARVNAEVLVSGTVGPMIFANKIGAKYPKSDNDLKTMILDFLLPQVWGAILSSVDGMQPKATLLPKNKMSLGKKENIKIGSRFFAFENVENKDGEIVKKKRSMLRVKKVGDNRGLATGDSEKSKLYRIGPGSAKEGMLVQQKENLGLSLSGGFGALAHIRADYRIKAVTPGFLVFWDWNVYPGKVEFDIDEYQKQGLAYELHTANLDDSTYLNAGQPFKGFGSGDLSTSGMNMAFGMEKQIHLHPLVYVSPAVGLGWSTLSIEGNLQENIPLSEIDTSSNTIFASIFLEFGARVGVQLSGNLSLNLSIMATTGGAWYDFALNSGEYNYGGDTEEDDQEVLEEYYESVLKKMPGIMNGGIKTNIMLRYEF